jgi:hypothetical protein
VDRAFAFPEQEFKERLLGDPLRSGVPPLLAKLRQGRIVPMTGAGLSAGAPTSMPLARAVASELCDWARTLGLDDEVGALSDPTDLGEVTAMVEVAVGRQVLIAELINRVPWTGRPFNVGHLAIALMFGEQLVSTAFTLNWESGVAKAADDIEGLQLSCPSDLATMGTATPPHHIHIHGDPAHPAALVITNEDLRAPHAMAWTQPQLQAALTTGEPMLVGFAVEPEYVIETLENVFAMTQQPAAAVVDIVNLTTFRARSPRLSAATGINRPHPAYIQGYAGEVLAETMRGFYAGRAREMVGRAAERVEGVSGASPSDAAVDAVLGALLGMTLENFLALLWLSSYLSSDDGDAQMPVLARISEHFESALACLIVLADAANFTALENRGPSFRLRFSGSGGEADLWIVVPTDPTPIRDVLLRIPDRSVSLMRPGDDIIPLVAICARTDGRIPPAGHPALVAPSAPGTLASPTRSAAAAMDLDEIVHRRDTLGTGTVPHVEDLLRLP